MSSFGSVFKVTTFGESHCQGVGCVIDGCPPGLPLRETDIQAQLDRRRPGQSALTTPRNEKDQVSILSGVEYGLTLGTPIALLVPNEDQRPDDYRSVDNAPRPSHADYTYMMKYGIKASSGGGRSSARETIGRVAAGAIAEKILQVMFGVEIVAFVSRVGHVGIGEEDFQRVIGTVTRSQVDSDPSKCPLPEIATEIQKTISQAKDGMNSVGGVVSCVVRNLPPGLGEPCFDKLEAKLAHAMLSIPATKGFEIGSGFQCAGMSGKEHNDLFVPKEFSDGTTRLGTMTNNSGGIQGGISNGEPVYFRVAFKPPATISLPQNTSTYTGDQFILEAKGRHDPCVVPRAIPIVEAMTALVLMDAVAIQQSRIAIIERIRLHAEERAGTDSQEEEELKQKQALMRAGSNGKPFSAPFRKPIGP